MATRWANIKKLAGLGVIAAGVTAAGLGLGAGTAQAVPFKPHPNPIPHIFNRVDTRVDRHEGSPVDRVFDRFFEHK